jgi:hypothetical protein
MSTTPPPAQFADREHARALIEQMRKSGESFEMLARWFAVALAAARAEGESAERERCAKIVEGPWPASELYPADVQFLKKHVAGLIRKPTRKGE